VEKNAMKMLFDRLWRCEADRDYDKKKAPPEDGKPWGMVKLYAMLLCY